MFNIKILYIKLKNFVNLHTSHNANEVSIDFTESKNKIILLTGPNGSGKTSVLSCLHPFATNGNLDIRSDNSLILEGENGYKEIHIENDGVLYIITHYYTPRENSHSVKSYIKKGDTELNINGNVTSFKEIVEEELDIEMDYLKLSRLGSNVTNFIDLSTTERKTFMGKILSEVDVFLKAHKKITEDRRKTKSIISHIIDKLRQLNINDIDAISDMQDVYAKDLIRQNDKISSLQSELNIIKHEISKQAPISDILDEMRENNTMLTKMNKVLNKSEYSKYDENKCAKELEKTKLYMSTLETELSVLTERRVSCIDTLDKLYIEADNLNREISRIEEDGLLKEMNEMIAILRKNIEKRASESSVSTYEPNFTKHELNMFIIALDECNDILVDTYTYGITAIRKSIDNMMSEISHHEYESKYKQKVKKHRMAVYCEYIHDEILKRINKKIEPCDCPSYDFYSIVSDEMTSYDDEIEDEDFVLSVKSASINIIAVINKLKQHDDLIQRLPDNIKGLFSIKTLMSNIENMKVLYEKSIIYSELSKVTEYELQEADLLELKELKIRKKLIEKSLQGSDYLHERMNEVTRDLAHIKDIELPNINASIDDIKSSLITQNKRLEDLTDLKISIEKKEIINARYNELVDVHKILENLHINKSSKEKTLNEVLFYHNKLKKEYDENEYKISSYISLNKELDEENKKYDEMTMIRASLSATEGMPLLYIEKYLCDTQVITNELLEMVYGDDMYIEEFDISADNFRIPYNRSGKQVSDICYASQGEKSFISVALSFALIYGSISKYNILLLDEIDATLDTSNREKFLFIVERIMEMIDVEQIFIITHNNMFNMYPVDIVDMKNEHDENNLIGNYIEINYK